MVTSSVVFIKVPAVEPQRVKRYICVHAAKRNITALIMLALVVLKLQSLVSLSFRTADQSGICYRDVCKEELFFPLTEAYQGEPREKTLALSLFLIFLALITFAVTKPWG